MHTSLFIQLCVVVKSKKTYSEKVLKSADPSLHFGAWWPENFTDSSGWPSMFNVPEISHEFLSHKAATINDLVHIDIIYTSRLQAQPDR